MSSTSALESNEDLENITLVRMEDVQPDRNSEYYEVLNLSPFIMNRVIDHDYSCVVNDEDSNIGSMVSIQSEEVDDCSGNAEFIEHNVLKPVVKKTIQYVTTRRDSWPTLEILPGGVIKHSEKFITNSHQKRDKDTEAKDMVYACAKCPMRFKFLFNLVKHVKLHENEKRKEKLCKSHIGSSISACIKKAYNQSKKKKVIKYKTKCKVPKK